MVNLMKNASLSQAWVSSHDRWTDFYLSSWQRGDSPWPLLVVRLLLAAAAVAVLVWSLALEGQPQWLAYLTNWGLMLLTVTELSALLISVLAVCRIITDVDSYLPWYISMYWLFYNITVSLAILITLLYWILLYNGEAESFWLDVATHAGNSCIALAELLVSRTPVKILHFYQPLGVGLWYVAFSVIYYFAGGTDGMGNHFIYEVLNWEKSREAGLMVLIASAGLLAVYAVVWCIALGRDRLSAVIRTTGHDLPYVHSESQTAIV